MAYAYPTSQGPADPTSVIGRRIGAFFIDAAVATFAFILIFVPLLSLLSKGHRRLGDMAAGTYVVAIASVGRPVVFAGPAPLYASAPRPMGAPPPPPPQSQPQWDPARNTYVQWDPASGRYLEW